MLGDALVGRYRRDIQRELIAGSILEDVEILGVALARAFTGDGFGGAEFKVSEEQLCSRRRIDRGGRKFPISAPGRTKRNQPELTDWKLASADCAGVAGEVMALGCGTANSLH